MASCLVLGGNGFLGSGVVDELAARGHEVTVFDRFSRTPARFSATARIIVGDFLDTAAVAAAVEGQQYVFHFISATTPASADADPGLEASHNLGPSVSLFEACVRSGVQRVYFASTGGAIYGDTTRAAVNEETRPEPVSPYAIGKLAIEGYLAYFRRKHGLSSVSFRISNPYGPRQRAHDSHGVIPAFLGRAAAGDPLVVYGDGSSVRDYVYADDAVRMIVDLVGRETAHSIYNIGSGEGTSLTQLLDVVREVTEHSLQVDYLPEPASFVHRSVLDTSRYRDEFGPAALLPLREGIAKTWHGMVATS